MTPEELRMALGPVLGALRTRSEDAPTAAADPVERLAALDDLVDRGFVSRGEFEAAKAKLLDSL